MRTEEQSYQVIVVGGGLAGVSAAVAAARNGIKTCLVQNRPVLGGNSSSEIRVTPHGAAAFHAYARETGIISELLTEERAQNHEEIFENGWTNSVWDMTIYDLVQRTENLTLMLNTDFREVRMKDSRRIGAIVASVQNAELEVTLLGDIFIDCTGDGTLADRAGCRWRLGSESRNEFGEPHAPLKASSDVMGSSIHFKTRRMEHPVPYTAPEWAIKYEDASFFYDNGRPPKDERGGYWWLEIGVPYDTIHQNEDVRELLTRHALGVWDWMKNRDPRMMERTRNYALDWIGQVPGKRESRRIEGRYLMTENDALELKVFDDEIAFGGWFIDLHTPGGLLAGNSEPASGESYDTFSEYAVKSYAGPYGISLRTLIAADVDNLMMAGRNVSVTHAAFGSVRVMGTGALLGQAAGTAAARALKEKTDPHALSPQAVKAVQQRLLRDGCFLLNYKNEDPDDIARRAVVTATSEACEAGAAPDEEGYHNGLSIWRDQPQYCKTVLHNRRGQLIAVGGERIDRIAICVSNLSNTAQKLIAKVVRPRHIFDYRIESLQELWRGEIDVPRGEKIWVEADVNLRGLEPGGWIRFDVMENCSVEWHLSGKIVTGHISTYQIAQDKMRRFGSGHTLSFRTVPAQPCYGARNVVNGISRPMDYTNLWKSDPARKLPQSITLAWEQEQEVDCVELTFPGHLVREIHAYGPFYRDPQCPSAYTVEALAADGWKQIASQSGNYQRHRRHVLDAPLRCTQIKVTVLETNGDPSAQIFEIRCYNDTKSIN